eukprot:gnl/MRDRNA2_/MRDRNA2_136844_c0_seq1.p1 gnl/MRDRNA2_/MRDRNA2_136844_c0~~gnl/MRDRNA2_/MRDRNA2_136844_c0_seq1.p1  ORF type:complete len:449 (+),score=63.56 gnl/MRDRNA2_/MRDRNA2_136844_c0_seq1:140-1486(+)
MGSTRIDLTTRPNIHGENPFAAGLGEFLKDRGCGNTPAPRRTPRKQALSARDKHAREQTILRALTRLDHRDTHDRAVVELDKILETLKYEEFKWFLRLAFNRHHPLQHPLARREQLLFLKKSLQKFGNEHPAYVEVLPLIIESLSDPGLHEVAMQVVTEILSVHISDEQSFLKVSPLVLKRFLNPLTLGSGRDLEVKKGCASILAGLTEMLMGKAMEYGHTSGGTAAEGSIGDLLKNYATLLMQAVSANHDLKEGLYQSLVTLAIFEPETIKPFMVSLADRCAAILLNKVSTDSPRGALEENQEEGPGFSRQLALVCCMLLWHLAERVAPLMEGHDFRPQCREVLAALAKENFTLQRLVRANEPLRNAIGHAINAWVVLGSAAEDIDSAQERPGGHFTHGSEHHHDARHHHGSALGYDPKIMGMRESHDHPHQIAAEANPYHEKPPLQ